MITGRKVKLRDIRMSDARMDYVWRTDPELARLDATPLLTIPFANFLLDYASALRFTLTRHRFAIETLDGSHIGNCMYYNINDTSDEAELGIMIGERDYWDKDYGTDAVTALVNHIFLQTDIERIYLKTLDWNKRAQKCFEKCGFTPCGHLSQHWYYFLLMELYRQQWEEQCKKYR